MVNYLHLGNVLGQPAAMSALPLDGVHSKLQVLGKLRGLCGEARELAGLMQAYGPKHSKRIDIGQFRLDIARSLAHRRFFSSLGCRGFSYRVEDEIDFCEPLRKRITLRVALMPGEQLFYPPRVKRYLRRVNSNHYFSGGFPSIAFALGIKRPDAWFVFVMQSDVALRSPSYIREHFRGWRKVLFANIVRLAHGNASMLYLCRAEDVLRACHSGFSPPRTVPTAWHAIYDQTAGDFHMQIAQLSDNVDVQLFPRQPRIFADSFHALPHPAFTGLCPNHRPGVNYEGVAARITS